MLEKIKGKAKELYKEHEDLIVIGGTCLALGMLLHEVGNIGYNKGYCDGWFKTINTLNEAMKLAEK